MVLEVVDCAKQYFIKVLLSNTSGRKISCTNLPDNQAHYAVPGPIRLLCAESPLRGQHILVAGCREDVDHQLWVQKISLLASD